MNIPNAIINSNYTLSLNFLCVLDAFLLNVSYSNFLQFSFTLFVALPFDIINYFLYFVIGLLKHKVT